MSHRRSHGPRQARQRGFTLLELVVALAIFALMAAFAYAGLGSVLNLSAATGQMSERLGEVQRAIARIERDLETAIVRRPRGELTEEGEPPFSAGGAALFELTRAGVPNPLGLPRSELQRVAWSFSGGELLRLAWPQLDVPAGAEQPVAEVVLGDVSEVQLFLRDGQGQEQIQWPLAEQDPGARALPLAVDLRITLGDWGLVRRLIVLPEGPADVEQPG